MGMGFIKLPVSFISLFENLSYEEIGRAVMAMFAYFQTGEEPKFESNDPLRYVWPMCRDNVIESTEAYERKCETLRENGKKGGRPPKQRPDDLIVLDD